MNKTIYALILILFSFKVSIAQDILPPVQTWNGKSTSLIASEKNPWITPTEKSGFNSTPDYAQTNDWLNKLIATKPFFKMVSIGTSAQGRKIYMVIAAKDVKMDAASIANSKKPTLLMQAGIHAGEIDGKDAGMMLLRDIAIGGKEKLLDNVNILFIPILNVDGHERSSAYNRVNQRGPDNMGWRTNARNLNLNRDYTKLETEEVKAVVEVINTYKPTLYLDLHVTDGADYQYDITYGFSEAYSPSSAGWLSKTLSPYVNKRLSDYGHIPGPLLFTANDRDFTEGALEYGFSARFSNNYADLIHLPSILLENHSLKPFKQRVLGTYIFLEAILEIVGKEGKSLKASVMEDEKRRNPEIILSWKDSEKPDSMLLLGIESNLKKSFVTNKDVVEWTGKPVTQKIKFQRTNSPDKKVTRPKAYWVPGTYKDVIDKLAAHGIKMEKINKPMEIEVTMLRITKHKFNAAPFEGRFGVSTEYVEEKKKETFYPGSVRIDLNQPKGDLAIHLLDPASPDAFISWGYFNEIFSRTEYIEAYAIDPLAKKMLADNDDLMNEYKNKIAADSTFLNNPYKVYEWFYRRSPYYDQRYLLYPVGIER